MKKRIIQIVAGVLFLVSAAAGWAYFTYYPRHYEASEFDNLADIAYAAENLRASGLRGRVARDYLPAAIWDLEPQEVRVYPTGVLIRLKGFFTYESGLYIPSEEVAGNITEMELKTYLLLGQGVFSYKVEG